VKKILVPTGAILDRELTMKIFDPHHIQPGWPAWWQHFKQAIKMSSLMIGSGLLGLVHALVPFFLPEFLALASARIQWMLDENN